MRTLSIGADLRLPDGQVMHALVQTRFDRAIHLTLDDGRLLTLLQGDSSRGMRVINVDRMDWPTLHRCLDAGSHATLSRTQLTHARFVLPLDGASLWRSPELTGDEPSAEAVQACRAWMYRRQGVTEAGMPVSAWRFWRAALAAFIRVVDALPSHVGADGADKVDAAVGQALGLGPGLTPSADDMIAGLLIGLRMNPVMTRHTARLATSVRRHWHATSAASRDALDQAMLGWTTSRMADVCMALTYAAQADGLEHALAAQAAIGQYSGMDTLIGFCAGLESGLADRSGAMQFQAGLQGRHTAPYERISV